MSTSSNSSSFLFASAVIDYDYIMKLIAKYSGQDPKKMTISREQLIGLIQSDAKFLDEREEITEYVRSLTEGEGLDEAAIRAGYEQFKAEKQTKEIEDLAQAHRLTPESLSAFVGTILQRMIFDGEQLTDLMEPLGLGWRKRRDRELALMADLVPLLNKRADGRAISGLNAYEQGGGEMTADKPTPVPRLRFPEFRDAPPWSSSPLESVCEVLNKRRIPITKKDRKAGPFPYYGASGIVDYVDDFMFDERLILVGEDGAKWGPFEQTAFIADGKCWVNNHAHVLRSVSLIDSLLEAHLVRSDLGRYVTGAAPPKLTLGKLKTIPIPIPSSPTEQQKIADCLGSLDDLIAAEDRKLEALRQHKQGLMQQLFPQPGETVPRLRFPEFSDEGAWEETTNWQHG